MIRKQTKEEKEQQAYIEHLEWRQRNATALFESRKRSERMCRETAETLQQMMQILNQMHNLQLSAQQQANDAHCNMMSALVTYSLAFAQLPVEERQAEAEFLAACQERLEQLPTLIDEMRRGLQ